MRIKAFISDFDGTIVKEDLSDVLSGLVGKREESEKLSQLFHSGQLKGLEGLIRRINFLQGVSVAQMAEAVAEHDYLRDGARELFAFLKARGIITIIASGSTIPFLEIYQQKLGADYLVGSKPVIKDGTIVSISAKNYSGPDFKMRDSKAILDSLGITADEVVAIGDSPADQGIFELAAKSIAINPHGGIEKYAEYVIHDDLSQAIPILKGLIAG